MKLNKSIFDMEEAELLELKRKYPFSSVLDFALNKKSLVATHDISLVRLLELIKKTNNSGLSFTSVIGDYKSLRGKTGVKNIIPKDDESGNNDSDEESDGKYLNEGISSEHLAKIYLKQGLKKEAIEIYKKISLYNKKKSSTFAKF